MQRNNSLQKTLSMTINGKEKDTDGGEIIPPKSSTLLVRVQFNAFM